MKVSSLLVLSSLKNYTNLKLTIIIIMIIIIIVATVIKNTHSRRNLAFEIFHFNTSDLLI